MVHKLLSYDSICKAVGGDTESICMVIDHFDGYINKLSMRRCSDAGGSQGLYLHEDIKRELIVELIVKLPLFKCEE